MSGITDYISVALLAGDIGLTASIYMRNWQPGQCELAVWYWFINSIQGDYNF